MYQFDHPALTTVYRKNESILRILLMLLLTMVGCNLINREYSIPEQYDLAESRLDSMKGQLDFNFTLEKEILHIGDTILFTGHFTNKTDASLTVRLPQQSGILDVDDPKTTLQYSISPLDQTVALRTPLLLLGMPYLFSNPVQSNEFEILEPYASKDVKLELPNMVYLKHGGKWVESVLPPGKYSIHLIYENLYIGYEIEKKDQTYFIDKSAWVGQIEAEPVLLTILP